MRSEKNETHTEGTSGDGQNAKTRMDDPYMNSLYGSSTYGSGNYEQKNTAYTGGTYGSQNTSGQIDIENLKKENQKNKTEKTVLWVILAVLTSPVWITVAAVLVAILVAVLACVFAVAVSIVAVMAALVITGFVLAGIGVGYLFTKRRGSRSWTVRRWTFGSCAWSTCSVGLWYGALAGLSHGQ